jgi:hypothetical protein
LTLVSYQFKPTISGEHRFERLVTGRRRLDAVIREVAIEGISSARAVGERHVSVRPEQIKRIAGQAVDLIFRSPLEGVR